LRLNAVALVFVGLASAAFPIHAEQKYVAQAQPMLSASAMRPAIKLPDYVPVLNYDQFLLASRGEDFGSRGGLSPAARSAAEALSAKFAASSDGLHGPAASDPEDPGILDASFDPKRVVKLANLMPSPGLADPAKVARMAIPGETQSAEIPQPAVRNVQPAARRASSSRSRIARRGGARQHRNRVAAAAPQQKSTSISASLDRLVGFGTFTPDHRLTR
jgi:hypothetical protein